MTAAPLWNVFAVGHHQQRQHGKSRFILHLANFRSWSRAKLKVFLLCAVIVSANTFTLNENAREKRTVMIPPHVLEALLPVLEKILPEEKLTTLQGLLVKAMLVPDPNSNGGEAPSGEQSLVETLEEPAGASRFLAGGGLARIEEPFRGTLVI